MKLVVATTFKSQSYERRRQRTDRRAETAGEVSRQTSVKAHGRRGRSARRRQVQVARGRQAKGQMEKGSANKLMISGQHKQMLVERSCA